jgi:phosphatidylethanolamine/phosphatidyl-N-methylethanolamine N-methyltransferase
MTIRAERAERIYTTYSGVYDLLFDTILHPGRERAVEALKVRPGDRVLEVGVGTGLSLLFYPSHCEVTGIDISAAMLEKAEKRARELGMRNLVLLRMEAEHLTLADASFDRVLASYVISTVADPRRVVQELWRVCRPGGTVVILNHFRSPNRILASAERALTPLTRRLGFVLDLGLEGIVGNGHFTLDGIEKVNLPPLWSVVRLTRRPG